jgi:2-dehydropantoate 2-reductase
MRIAILGAGAMGSIFGAQLVEAGLNPVLIDVNPNVVETLNGTGMSIRHNGAERRVRVRATTDPSGEKSVDLLLVFVKCWATESALKLAAPVLGPGTFVLSLQNGRGNGETIARYVAPERILLGVTYHSGAVRTPSNVDHTASGTTYLGPYRGGDLGAAQQVAVIFTAAGLPTEATADVDGRIWRKLMLNVAANPVAALTGLRSVGLVEQREIDSLMEGIAGEAVAVAQAEGQAVETEETIEYIRRSLRAAGPSIASMRQDVMAGRPTEIDVITGAIIEAAQRHGIAVPLNRAIYALIKGYEATRT